MHGQLYFLRQQHASVLKTTTDVKINFGAKTPIVVFVAKSRYVHRLKIPPTLKNKGSPIIDLHGQSQACQFMASSGR